MPAYLTAVYNISFSRLRALSQQISFVDDHVFLKKIMQHTSDSEDEC